MKKSNLRRQKVVKDQGHDAELVARKHATASAWYKKLLKIVQPVGGSR